MLGSNQMIWLNHFLLYSWCIYPIIDFCVVDLVISISLMTFQRVLVIIIIVILLLIVVILLELIVFVSILILIIMTFEIHLVVVLLVKLMVEGKLLDNW